MKLVKQFADCLGFCQPPSGGCVLKHFIKSAHFLTPSPAAFGRLCVETVIKTNISKNIIPAAFGRLCVETPRGRRAGNKSLPAAFGRLCVETTKQNLKAQRCWPGLCVETPATTNSMQTYSVSHLKVAVCSNIVQAGHFSFDPSLSEALVKAVEDIRSKL